MGEEDADVDEEPSQDDSEEIEGVIENPLFEPEQDVNISSIEKFSMDAIDDDDLDFEPDIEEANDQGKSSKLMESECRTFPGREENDTAGTKDDKEDDEGNKTIDELGDKIDAAYPGQENKKKLDDDDDESDEEKRGWRSEKGKDSTRNKSPVRRRSRSPIRRRRVSPPRTRISRRRSRSSSIEIVSVGSRPRGRRISPPRPRSRSRDRFIRRSFSPQERRRLEDLRYERKETERMRRQVEDLRESMHRDTGYGSVSARLARISPPRRLSPPPRA